MNKINYRLKHFTTFWRIRLRKLWLDFPVGGNEHREFHLRCHCHHRFRPLARTCTELSVQLHLFYVLIIGVEKSASNSLCDDDSAISFYISQCGQCGQYKRRRVNDSVGCCIIMCTWWQYSTCGWRVPRPLEASLLLYVTSHMRSGCSASGVFIGAEILFGKASNYK